MKRSYHIGQVRMRVGTALRRFAGRATALGLSLTLVLAGHAAEEKAKPTEYQVKAAYLYHFGRFVEWPAGLAMKHQGFEICVLGQDPFGPTLDAAVAGEAIEQSLVRVRRITNASESASCRILFISTSEESNLKKILNELRKDPVLTVSDIPHFVQRGGMIRFVPEDNRVRFEVNLGAAQDAGLILSSELLKVAVNVERSSRARN